MNFFVVYNLLAAVLAGFLIAYSCSPSDVYRGCGPDIYPSRVRPYLYLIHLATQSGVTDLFQWYFWVIAVIPNAVFDVTIFAWFLPRKVVSRAPSGKRRAVIFFFIPQTL